MDQKNALVTWAEPLAAEVLMKSVEDIKKQHAFVKIENVIRLPMAQLVNSSFDIIYSNIAATQNIINDQYLALYMSLLKPGGVIIAYENDTADNTKIKSAFVLNGFTNFYYSECNGSIKYEAQKPDFEMGSSRPLKLGAKVPDQVASAWKLDGADDDNLIEADDLLDEDDLKKPDPASLRVCGTTGKRKACKDCSCGLADELAGEAPPVKTSSCGSCYLGDAFRCSSCPYLGMPAFKPGEKVMISGSQLEPDI